LNKVVAMKASSADRRDYIGYPTNRVVGTVGDAGKTREATDALLRAGFNREDIDILHGEEDLHRLDLTGAEHGFLAQFQRTVIRTFELEEFKHLTHHVEDVRAGRFVIMVRTKRRGQRIVAADILHHYGAEFVGFYGRWAWADLPATGQWAPADVPALFARAWNARDPDALAALFDEDAEFVNVTGLSWHDRESIRKAHASRLERLGDTSVLALGETKVKLLSPEVAVVHARMTFSGDSPAGAGPRLEPRTTIVSFVVHRAGDRWLCASAHNTDLIPEHELNVVGSGPGVDGRPATHVESPRAHRDGSLLEPG
jgi:uncharacterized protein (TIGR02246 family)